MGLADLHIHTVYSWDGTATVSAVLKTAMIRGLNVIAITDHDEIQGALDAQKLAPDYGLDMCRGLKFHWPTVMYWRCLSRSRIRPVYPWKKLCNALRGWAVLRCRPPGGARDEQPFA